MTRIGVKLKQIRNLYVLVVFAPGSRKRILERREARRPWPPLAAGDMLRAGGKRLRVTSIATCVDRHADLVEHVIEIYTRPGTRRRPRRGEPSAANVVRMPTGDSSTVAEFLRYHVLVRVFDGDPDAWLAHLLRSGGDGGDVRFVRWIRSRLRQDPALLTSIEKMVSATPFWRVAEA